MEERPTCALDSGRWSISNNYDLTDPIKVTIGNLRESVYVYNCKNVSIHIANKCNNIVIDHSSNVELHFDSVLATIEICHSTRVRVICLRRVSCVSVDRVDGLTLTLPPDSLDVRILTCVSTEMNVRWPDASKPDGYVERPIPQQFQHVIHDNKVITSPAVLY